MAFVWKGEQKNIFDCYGKNILVSASAGSGKTTVMIHKIIDLVTKEDDKTPISNFLIVTFTKASAVDMKKKLIEAFMERQDDPFCLEQIDEVETSDISNLHSFCSRLISTYFYEVNVDPAFQVLDGTIADFLQDKALEKLFEKKEKQNDEEYLMLFDIFQKKRNDEQLKKIIKTFNNFLNSNLDAKKWFEETTNGAYDIDLSKNTCAKLINNYVSNRIRELCDEINDFALICKNAKLDKVYEYFVEYSGKLACINSKNSYEVNAKNIFEIEPPKSVNVPANEPLKASISELRTRIRKQVENFEKNFISSDSEYLKQGLTKTREIVVALYKLVGEFNEIYDEMKREINGLDFNDLEKKALIILNNDEILQVLRNKYKYVFVDEYQDINSVQEEIISKISGLNNRFMVGDIKQSIYRFRLCDPDIFLQKYEEYSAKNELSRLFKLNCNFRSDKKILEFVDLVFSGVMTEDFGGIDYARDSKFVPDENNLDNPNSVNLFFVDTTKEKQEKENMSGVYSVKNHIQLETEEEEKGVIEARLVANTISKIIEEVGFNNFHFGDVAVLVGSRNAMVAKFIETLKSYGIKVASDEKFDLMKEKYVQEIINFIKLSCNPNDDFVMFKVLKSRLFNFSDEDLVKIRLIDQKTRFFDCVMNFSAIEDVELKNKLEKFKKELVKFSMLAKVLSVKQLCKKIVDDFSIYQINDASGEFEKANENIDLMIGALPETDAFDFVLNYDNFSLEVENECGGDNVSVMTIHKSKGIEFKYVFLINTTNEFNFESTYESVVFNKYFGVGIDFYDTIERTQIPTIASSGIKLLEKRKLVEEQQRVLYVALTRAKEKLFVICSKEQEKIAQKNKAHKKCYADWFEPIIYNELYGKHNPLINFVKFRSSELSEKSNGKTRAVYFKDQDEKEPEWFVYQHLDANNFRLKTSISKILKETQSENEKFVGTGSSADRGTDYHKFLQKIDLKKGGFDEQVENIAKTEKFKAKLDLNLIKNLLKMSIFDEISRANYILTEREFYAKLSTDIIKASNADSEFVLQGVIDLIAIFDDYFIIIDYKTGKCNNEKLISYKKQLDTYSEIAERIYHKKAQKKALVFIDEEKIIEI